MIWVLLLLMWYRSVLAAQQLDNDQQSSAEKKTNSRNANTVSCVAAAHPTHPHMIGHNHTAFLSARQVGGFYPSFCTGLTVQQQNRGNMNWTAARF